MRPNTPAPGALPTALILLLAACGGSSGGGGSDDDGGGGGGGGGGSVAGDERFHLVQGSLLLVDPADPDTVFEVEAGDVAGLDLAFVGQVAAGGGSLEGVTVEKAVYARGATVYELPLAVERVNGLAQAPTPTPIVTLPAAVVDLSLEVDFSGAEPVYVYLATTAGGVEHVRQDAGGVSAPQPFPGEPLVTLVDTTDGSLEGWLARDGGSLVRVDRDLVASVVAPVLSDVTELASTAAGDVFLVLDGQLHSYRLDGTLTDLGTSVQGFSTPTAASGGELFLALGAAGGTSFQVLRTDVDGPVEPVGQPWPGLAAGLELTPSRVVVAYTALVPFEWRLESMTRDGQDPVLLDSVAGAAVATFPFSPGAGERVYYNLLGVAARAVDADGGGAVERPGGTWLQPQVADVLVAGGEAGIETLFLSLPTGSGGMALDAVSPLDPAGSLRRLGEVDPKYTMLSTVPTWTDTHLVTAFEDAGPASQTDVLFFDSTEAGSLVTITDTAGESELGLW